MEKLANYIPAMKKVKLTDGRVAKHRNDDALQRILQVVRILPHTEKRNVYRFLCALNMISSLYLPCPD